MSGLRDPWYRRAKIRGRVADALPAFCLIPCPAHLFLRPIRTGPYPHAGAGNYKKEDILSRSPTLWSAVRPISRPAYLPSATIASLSS